MDKNETLPKESNVDLNEVSKDTENKSEQKGIDIDSYGAMIKSFKAMVKAIKKNISEPSEKLINRAIKKCKSIDDAVLYVVDDVSFEDRNKAKQYAKRKRKMKTSRKSRRYNQLKSKTWKGAKK